MLLFIFHRYLVDVFYIPDIRCWRLQKMTKDSEVVDWPEATVCNSQGEGMMEWLDLVLPLKNEQVMEGKNMSGWGWDYLRLSVQHKAYVYRILKFIGY